jgi:hypothetical protein
MRSLVNRKYISEENIRLMDASDLIKEYKIDKKDAEVILRVATFQEEIMDDSDQTEEVEDIAKILWELNELK